MTPTFHPVGNCVGMNGKPADKPAGEAEVEAMVARLHDLGLPERDCIAIGFALFVAYWHGRDDRGFQSRSGTSGNAE